MKKVLFVAFALLAAAFAAQLTGNEPIPIIKQDSDVNFDGTYDTSYETGNGILFEEHGAIKNPGNKDLEAADVHGIYQYTDLEGKVFSVSYVADETGFHPEGAHLPVPPPIPPLIAKALEYNLAHPEQDKL